MFDSFEGPFYVWLVNRLLCHETLGLDLVVLNTPGSSSSNRRTWAASASLRATEGRLRRQRSAGSTTGRERADRLRDDLGIDRERARDHHDPVDARGRDRAQAVGDALRVSDCGEAVDERVGQRARVRAAARAVVGHVVALVRARARYRAASIEAIAGRAAVHAGEARGHRDGAAHGLARDLDAIVDSDVDVGADRELAARSARGRERGLGLAHLGARCARDSRRRPP